MTVLIALTCAAQKGGYTSKLSIFSSRSPIIMVCSPTLVRSRLFSTSRASRARDCKLSRYRLTSITLSRRRLTSAAVT